MSISFPPPSAQYLVGAPPSPARRHGTEESPLLVVVSLDVEEEGLFSGQYAASNCSIRNVSLLRRLEPISRELGFPLTLLCAHTVFADASACNVLAHMRDNVGAEIGAHLHHWSTPPLGDTAAASGPPLRSHRMDRGLLRERLRTLLRSGREFQGSPLTSFRMGRWDLRDAVRPMLAEEGLLVDSSVCPLRAFDAGKDGQVADGPDHFLAPADPYWAPLPTSPDQVPDQIPNQILDQAPPVAGPFTGPGPRLLEVPITQVAWSPWLARAWYAATAGTPRLDMFKFWGALSPNPVWHGSQVMRMAARLHVARGGRVLSLFWHSSEMLPGGSPNIPDQKAADALLDKIVGYLRWLRETWTVRGVTLTSLYSEPDFPALAAGVRQGDW